MERVVRTDMGTYVTFAGYHIALAREKSPPRINPPNLRMNTAAGALMGGGWPRRDAR